MSTNTKLCLSNVVVIASVLIAITVIVQSIISDFFYRRKNENIVIEEHDNILDTLPEEIVPLSALMTEEQTFE